MGQLLCDDLQKYIHEIWVKVVASLTPPDLVTAWAVTKNQKKGPSRFFSRAASAAAKVPGLTERVSGCEHCGQVLDRDLNAAAALLINLEQWFYAGLCRVTSVLESGWSVPQEALTA